MNYACLALGALGINNWLPKKCGTESITHELESAFAEHLSEYGISYGTMEEFYFRLRQYAAKDAEYNRINADSNNTFTVGHNHMSSWTDFEYKKLLGYKGKSGELLEELEEWAELDTDNLADSVDWRTKGAVNPVKNQARCGSCWAFSAVASMEGHHFIKTGKLLSLSEQQFVDCDKTSHGCNGGLQELAMKYSMGHAEELETDYPYKGKDGTCAEVSSKGQVKTTKINYVKRHDSQALLAAIALGPTSVTVEADKSVFQGYKSGVLNSRECGTNLDHAITAVGYGTESGQQYYLFRNSWGPTWGDKGYIKIATENKLIFNYGICGIQQTSLWATTD